MTTPSDEQAGSSEPVQKAIAKPADTSTKVRRPYNLSKQRERWTEAEHAAFLEALQKYGRAWKLIEEHIGTKTTVQIRSHAQKFFTKLDRERATGASAGTWPIVIPPPRPKRKSNQTGPVKPASSPAGSGSFIVHDILRERAQQLLGGGTDPHLVGMVAASAATAATSAAAMVISAAQKMYADRCAQQQEACATAHGGPEAGASPTSAGLTDSHASGFFKDPSPFGISGPNAFLAEAHKPLPSGPKEQPMQQQGGRPSHYDSVSEDWEGIAQTAANAAGRCEVLRLQNNMLPPWDQSSASQAAAHASLQKPYPRATAATVLNSHMSHQSIAALGEAGQSSSSLPHGDNSEDSMAGSSQDEDEDVKRGQGGAQAGREAPHPYLAFRPGLEHAFGGFGASRTAPTVSRQHEPQHLPGLSSATRHLEGMPLSSVNNMHRQRSGPVGDEPMGRRSSDEPFGRRPSTTSTFSDVMVKDITQDMCAVVARQGHTGRHPADRWRERERPVFSPGPALGDEAGGNNNQRTGLSWQLSDPQPFRRGVKRPHLTEFAAQRSMQPFLHRPAEGQNSADPFSGPQRDQSASHDPFMPPLRSVPERREVAGPHEGLIQPVAMHASARPGSMGMAAPRHRAPIRPDPDRPHGFQPYAAVQAAQAAGGGQVPSSYPYADSEQE